MAQGNPAPDDPLGPTKLRVSAGHSCIPTCIRHRAAAFGYGFAAPGASTFPSRSPVFSFRRPAWTARKVSCASCRPPCPSRSSARGQSLQRDPHREIVVVPRVVDFLVGNCIFRGVGAGLRGRVAARCKTYDPIDPAFHYRTDHESRPPDQVRSARSSHLRRG